MQANSSVWRAAILSLGLFPALLAGAATQVELKNLTVNGGIDEGKAHWVIEANVSGLPGEKERVLFATSLQHLLQISRERQTHTVNATFDILQGDLREIPLTLSGDGEIKKVTGDALLDWSLRQETNGVRSLVLRPRKTDKPLAQFNVTILAERETRSWSNPVQPLTFLPPHPALFSGYLRVETSADLDAQPVTPSGLVPIEARFLPEPMRIAAKPGEPEPLAFRFQGSAYGLPLNVTLADPEARRVVLRDFQLRGDLSGTSAAFTLTATARVLNPRGGSIALLSGGLALAELEQAGDWRVRFTNNQFVLVFDKPGEFPIRVRFHAAVRPSSGWNSLEFQVAPSGLQPVSLAGPCPPTPRSSWPARPDRSAAVVTSGASFPPMAWCDCDGMRRAPRWRAGSFTRRRCCPR